MSTPDARPPSLVWDTGRNTSLMKAVNEWAVKAGWKVLWRSSTRAPVTDRRLEAPLRFEGAFPDALSQLFQLYRKSDHPFTVDSYPQQFPPLVVITEFN